MNDELVKMECDIPVWLYERYNRVSKATGISIDIFISAAISMGIFQEYDAMSDEELRYKTKGL